MKVSPNRISPSQDFLKPETVGFILDCIKSGEVEKLPPDPIVRTDEVGNLVAIDGHNLIAVRLHKNEDLEVHLATSADDGLPATTKANVQRNADLKSKYDTALAERNRLHEQGINSFGDLISKYPELFQ